jgi:quercetin dioxygenase-like cupin family protein
MFETTTKSAIRRSLFLAGLAAASLTLATNAFAGECPADKTGKDVRDPLTLGPQGVTDTVIAMIDVSKEPANIDRKFRMRKLTIEPGGIVPWHSHGDRPAIIYIVSGEIHEYASNCSAPIVHKTGEVVAETSQVSHWWKNLGDETVVLLSADLLKDEQDHNM